MHNFLTPMLFLIAWTCLMALVMLWFRVPAMSKIEKDPQAFIKNPKLYEKLPKRAIWAADNYNHLHEQPVIFYALMGYLALSGQGDSLNMYLAWGYVVTRILHSFVQINGNVVKVRFGLFMLGSLCIFVMTVRALLALF